MDDSRFTHRTVWLEPDGRTVGILDQTRLPFETVNVALKTSADAEIAIRDMLVRGAPLIGAVGAYGLALALAEDASDTGLAAAYDRLHATRPTAINLRWALDDVRARVAGLAPTARVDAAYARAREIADEDVAINRAIGENAFGLIEARHKAVGGGRPVNILTHCNAGFLATVGWGTALAGIFMAHARGLPVHVWVDETRPRSQGAYLTAWELREAGVPHTVIADNAGGHLMQHGQVDMCIVGTDRVAANGDVCNKVGTYLKALAAFDNGVPFYVALPYPTIDWRVADGVRNIPIEERSPNEVTQVRGRLPDGAVADVTVIEGSAAANPAFDVTPGRLVTGLITERGVCAASGEGLRGLYPERAAAE
ncbi:methylthioribose-1-phosphate isomerase [Tistrella bauzanensis]|uniref:Methylthioribose-1-phosphate isomerase n=1 Tax=Tistrella bauzanensis TaxID=657419 RepID=A0ABQ1I983_9PROT|nr:S-methyl-5-thioribose-1-phosphate isomerase [Tistrella bauzanensis]GGB24040.1 methylthioribose-1-phosphate isomerase [Tistrella bauzanensis]